MMINFFISYMMHHYQHSCKCISRKATHQTHLGNRLNETEQHCHQTFKFIILEIIIGNAMEMLYQRVLMLIVVSIGNNQ